jgi:hypothetical protein
MIYDDNSRVFIRANAFYNQDQCFGTAFIRNGFPSFCGAGPNPPQLAKYTVGHAAL